MRILTIDGRLGKDAEMKKTQNGKEFITFSIANNTYMKGEEKTVWYDISVFSVDAYRSRMQYFTKGSYVSVTGVPDETAYVTRSGEPRVQHSVLADRVEFLKIGKKEGETNENVNYANRPNNDGIAINPVVAPSPMMSAPSVAAPTPYPYNTASSQPSAPTYIPPTQIPPQRSTNVVEETIPSFGNEGDNGDDLPF